MTEEQACLVRARSDSDNSATSFGSIVRTMAYTEDRLTDGSGEPGTVSMTAHPPEQLDNESGELIDYSDTSALDQFHEDALRQAGCGLAQLKVYLACSLALAGATLELSAVPFVLPSCEIELCILPHEKNWLVLISLVGGSLGGVGWGALGARLGRRRALVSALAVNAVFAAVAAFMPTYGTFMTARCVCTVRGGRPGGGALGGVGWGALGARLGRRRALVSALAVNAVFAAVAAFMPTYGTFMTARCVCTVRGGRPGGGALGGVGWGALGARLGRRRALVSALAVNAVFAAVAAFMPTYGTFMTARCVCTVRGGRPGGGALGGVGWGALGARLGRRRALVSALAVNAVFAAVAAFMPTYGTFMTARCVCTVRGGRPGGGALGGVGWGALGARLGRRRALVSALAVNAVFAAVAAFMPTYGTFMTARCVCTVRGGRPGGGALGGVGWGALGARLGRRRALVSALAVNAVFAAVAAFMPTYGTFMTARCVCTVRGGRPGGGALGGVGWGALGARLGRRRALVSALAVNAVFAAVAAFMPTYGTFMTARCVCTVRGGRPGGGALGGVGWGALGARLGRRRALVSALAVNAVFAAVAAFMPTYGTFMTARCVCTVRGGRPGGGALGGVGWGALGARLGRRRALVSALAVNAVFAAVAAFMPTYGTFMTARCVCTVRGGRPGGGALGGVGWGALGARLGRRRALVSALAVNAVFAAVAAFMPTYGTFMTARCVCTVQGGRPGGGALGGVGWGALGARLGRRRALVSALAVNAVFAAVAAFMPTYGTFMTARCVCTVRGGRPGGGALGGVGWGALGARLGRRRALVSALAVNAVFAAVAAFMPTYGTFMTARCVCTVRGGRPGGGALGGVGWGALGARLGRRRALVSALAVNAVFAAVAAFMPTYGTFMTARCVCTVRGGRPGGGALGGVGWGALGARLGRRRALVSALAVNAVFAAVAAFMPTYGTFMTARCVCTVRGGRPGGGALGGVGWGALGARLGRRRALVSALAVNAVFAAVAAFMPTYGTFMTARFCSAIGSGGLVPCCYAYCYSVSPRAHRKRLLATLVAAHGAGALLAAALAHAILPTTGAEALLDDKEHFSKWHRYLLLCTLPILASLVSLIWTQESPRYLLDVGREVDAMLVYQSIHSSNQIRVCGKGGTEAQYRLGALQLPPKRPAPALHHVRHSVKMFWQAFFQLFSSAYRNTTLSLGGLMLFSMAVQFFLASYIPSAVESIENQEFEASKLIIENATYEHRHFNTTLENVEYRNVTFRACTFRDMMLSHAKFRNCSFYEVAFSNIKTSYAYFTGSLFVNTTIIDTDITVGREIDAWSSLRNSVVRGMRVACPRAAPLTWRLAGALREQAHAALATVLAGLFAGLFSPTLALGGKFAPRVILCVICVCLSPSIYLVQSETALYVVEAIYRVFLTLLFYIACVGVVDSYPANLRCTAHGLIMSVAYMGGAAVRGLGDMQPVVAAILCAALALGATAAAARMR